MLGIIASLPLIATGPIWAPKGMADDADSHVAFRGAFTTTAPDCSLKIVGASEYLVWLDGKLIHDGPARFAREFPEYQTVSLKPTPGKHTLAVHVRNAGVTTRILSAVPPFLWCYAYDGSEPTPIAWKCARIPGYQARAKRISDILGWIDWCDTGQVWPDWQKPEFDDAAWQTPVEVNPGVGPITAAKTKPVRMDVRPIKDMASGKMINDYGYEGDDPAVRFFLDDLDPKGVPAQGVWRRYDLGRVRLGRPKITLDLPKGAIVEYAMSEQLRHGRVHAWLTLSTSTSCNMDHFVARGGPQEFMPFTPKGGRFLEIHVRAHGPVKFLKEEFLERAYYPEPVGSFECDDPLLNKIWRTGVETVRACAEDALVDCPTRERGCWTGDVASVATDIAAVAYGDLSLSRRALVQAAQAARGDGLVAGVGPGDPGYLSTYAAQWVTACVHYWELTGDKTLLEELLPAAKRNLAAFEAKMTDNGLTDDLGWGFVDWGYVRNDGPSDMALNLHYLIALRSMERWEQAVSGSNNYEAQAQRLEAILKNWMSAKGWKGLGYHRASLALLAELVPEAEKPQLIASIKKHLLSCFPNDPNGPRLSDPGVSNERVMTPYFGHFALTALLNNGETDFVLGQYKKCWGWALGDDRTTWLEVFDLRWSHCHEWSGCPTWQLSRYVLGVRPRFDLGDKVFEVDLRPGKLKRASGVIPFGNGGTLKVSWTRVGQTAKVQLESTTSVRVRIGSEEHTVHASTVLPVRLAL